MLLRKIILLALAYRNKKEESPYMSMWNIRILESFYDLKYSTSGPQDGTGAPTFKIRKLSNNPWKSSQNNQMMHRNQEEAKLMVPSNQNIAEDRLAEYNRLAKVRNDYKTG